jgi:hypothetical protein
MSDRAKTNIAFTQLLIDYRKDIMPDVIDGWNDFTEERLCHSIVAISLNISKFPF